MNIRLQIGIPLADLPNIDGYRFRGVLENGDLIPCVVQRVSNGLYRAVTEQDKTPIFGSLRGWYPYQAALTGKGEE